MGQKRLTKISGHPKQRKVSQKELLLALVDSRQVLLGGDGDEISVLLAIHQGLGNLQKARD